MSGISRGVVRDASDAIVAVLPTWSDADLVADALDMVCQSLGGWSELTPEAQELADANNLARWPALTDDGWESALDRILGPGWAAKWHRARLMSPTRDELIANTRTFRAQAQARLEALEALR